jgi:flagellar protein FliS
MATGHEHDEAVDQAMLAHGRERFADHSVTTASPSRVVVMCFERIERDLQGAATALQIQDLAEASQLIGHAQDIISHLLDGIEASDWEYAGELSSIYSWCYGELLSAIAYKSIQKVNRVREMLANLGGAFTQAAAAVAPQTGAAQGAQLRARA